MSVTTPVYHEIIEFIAAGTTPEEVANYPAFCGCAAKSRRLNGA